MDIASFESTGHFENYIKSSGPVKNLEILNPLLLVTCQNTGAVRFAPLPNSLALDRIVYTF